MATLERREQTPGKVSYRVRWWVDGKQRSKSFKTHADARRWKAVLEGDLVNGSYIDPKSGQTTLSAFAPAALEALTIDVRETTRARIFSVYKVHIEPEFGHVPLTAITGAGVSAWVVRKNAEQSAASVRKAAHTLSRLLDRAVSDGLLRANPAASMRLPSEARHEQKFLTQSQALQLSKCIAPRFKAMVLVAVFGGLRFGELTGLQRQHVNPIKNTISVKRTLVEVGGKVSFGPPKTKTSVRTVTLPRSIMAALVSHMDTYTGADSEALVFTGSKEQPVLRTWFYRHYYQPATVLADVEGLRFHDLRHTFVALWVSLGRNPKEVSKAAGHSSMAFTLDRYGHLYDVDAEDLADELDALIGFSGAQELGLTRPHDMAETGQMSTNAGRPPLCSGLARRPLKAVDGSNSSESLPRSEGVSESETEDSSHTQATSGHKPCPECSNLCSNDEEG